MFQHQSFYLLAVILFGLVLVKGQSACGTGNSVATFTFTLKWKELAPDGFKRRVITVNDKYPGPLLRVQQGVDVRVTVANGLDQGSSIHWHGINQRGSPDMDGVAGISQEPISPGGNFTYCFRTTEQPPGTYLYHAHVGSQYPNGLYGPIIIDPVESPLRLYESRVQEDFFVLLNDWYHPDYESLVHNALATNRVPACANSLLVNGKGRVRCGEEILCTMGNDMGAMNASSSSVPSPTASTDMRAGPTSAPEATTSAASSTMSGMAGMQHRRQMPMDHNMTPTATVSMTASAGTSTSMPGMEHGGMTLDTSNLEGCVESSASLEIFPVKANGTYRFRFANIGAFTNLHVAIDQHKMTLIEADGILLKDTQTADVLTVAIGQRYSVLVKAEQKPGNYWLRTWRTDAMQKLEGRAIVRYEGAPDASPTEGPMPMPMPMSQSEAKFSNSLSIKPLLPTKPPTAANRTLNLNVRAFADNNWTMQGDIPGFFPDPNAKPLLTNPVSNPNIINLGYGDIVDLMLRVDNRSVDTMAHPFHLHGQSFWVLGYGTGALEPSKLNTIDPPFRDTEMLPANGWLVLRFVATNPGTWFFHCHVDLHMMAGLNLVFDVARDGMDMGNNQTHSSSGGKKVGWTLTQIASVAITVTLIICLPM